MGSVRLEPLGAAHLGAVAAMLSDPDVLRFTRVPEPTPADFPQQWLAIYEQGRRDGTREAFAVLDGDDRFVGVALAFGIDRAEAEAELGYIVAPEARGRGIGAALLRALTDWAFRATNVERIRLVVDVENPASLRIAERAGYTREGVMRSVHFKGGRRIDAWLLSRLRTDPAPPAAGGELDAL
jgi:RimJ/RimL family protein N-acetyltransferase